VITLPARTALGAAGSGVRATARALGWAAERAVRATQDRGTQRPIDPVTVPAAPGRPHVERARDTDLDPMTPTRTPPQKAPTKKAPAKKAPAKKAPATKLPASQVPLKSAPTPSLPTAPVEAGEPAPTQAASKKAPTTKAAAKKAPAKKAPAKKAAAKKAPSKKAAVLAPALGLTEAEALEVADPNGTPGVEKS
jgi:hypothetical protein